MKHRHSGHECGLLVFAGEKEYVGGSYAITGHSTLVFPLGSPISCAHPEVARNAKKNWLRDFT